MSSKRVTSAPPSNSSKCSESAATKRQPELSERSELTASGANAPTARSPYNPPRTAPRIKPSEGKAGIALSIEMTSQTALTGLFGSKEPAFGEGLAKQIFGATIQNGRADQFTLDFMTAFITNMTPRDELEAMMLAQMGTVHLAAMSFAARLPNAETLPQQEAAERAYTKLTRTFAAQMEALKRYRSNGEQKMTVEHVTVNAGGQAIVGNVMREGPGPVSKADTTP